MKGRRKIEPRGGMKFRALIVAAAATFALAAGARQTDGFSFAEDGIVTPRGRIAWNDTLRIPAYAIICSLTSPAHSRSMPGTTTESVVVLLYVVCYYNNLIYCYLMSRQTIWMQRV